MPKSGAESEPVESVQFFTRNHLNSNITRQTIRRTLHPDTDVYVHFIPWSAFQKGAQTFVQFNDTPQARSHRTILYLMWCNHKRRYRDLGKSIDEAQTFSLSHMYVTVVTNPKRPTDVQGFYFFLYDTPAVFMEKIKGKNTKRFDSLPDFLDVLCTSSYEDFRRGEICDFTRMMSSRTSKSGNSSKNPWKGWELMIDDLRSVDSYSVHLHRLFNQRSIEEQALPHSNHIKNTPTDPTSLDPRLHFTIENAVAQKRRHCGAEQVAFIHPQTHETHWTTLTEEQEIASFKTTVENGSPMTDEEVLLEKFQCRQATLFAEKYGTASDRPQDIHHVAASPPPVPPPPPQPSTNTAAFGEAPAEMGEVEQPIADPVPPLQPEEEQGFAINDNMWDRPGRSVRTMPRNRDMFHTFRIGHDQAHPHFWEKTFMPHLQPVILSQHSPGFITYMAVYRPDKDPEDPEEFRRFQMLFGSTDSDASYLTQFERHNHFWKQVLAKDQSRIADAIRSFESLWNPTRHHVLSPPLAAQQQFVSDKVELTNGLYVKVSYPRPMVVSGEEPNLWSCDTFSHLVGHMINEFEHICSIATTHHLALIGLIHGCCGMMSYSRVKANLLVTGPFSAGKSFVMKLCGGLLVDFSIVHVDYSSVLANTGEGDTRGGMSCEDEAQSKSLGVAGIDTSTSGVIDMILGRQTRNNTVETELAKTFATRSEFRFTHLAFDDNGKRKLIETIVRNYNSVWKNTNSSARAIDSAVQSRYTTIELENVSRPNKDTLTFMRQVCVCLRESGCVDGHSF